MLLSSMAVAIRGGVMTFYNNSHNNISNSVFSDNSRGIDFRASSSSQPTIIETSDLSYTNWGSAIAIHNSANPVIRYNNIHNNQSGVGVSDQAIPLINNNNFFDNINYGVEVNQWYNLTQFVDAQANWWGSPNGPMHIDNLNGDGDKVSDKVDYSDWLLDKY